MREYKARGALSGRIYIALFTISLFSCFNIFIGRNGFQDYTATDTFNSAYTIIFGDDNDAVSYNANSSVSNNFEHEKNENEDGIDNGTDGASKVSTVTGSGTSMTMKSDDDDDGGDTNLDDMYNDAPSGIKGAEHEEDDDGGDEVRGDDDENVGEKKSQEDDIVTDDDGGDVKDSDADAVNDINNDDDFDNDDYRGDMGYTTEDGRKRMNVLILYPDDWRHNSIGKENPIIQTPFLDSLADDGIRFRQNAVTTSICWQSRATLFSGQWASRHQSYKLKCPHFSKGRLWNQTWPILLEKDGYFVGHVGKWQFHSDNRKRFSWTKYHEGKHWYGRFGRGLVAAEDVAKDCLA